MRIAYLGHTARYPSHGVGRSTVALAEALALRGGCDELVIFRARAAAWDAFPSEALSSRVQFVDMPSLAQASRAFRVFWEQIMLPSRLNGSGFDLVHSPSYILPLRSDVPSVVTVHDLIALTRPEFCKRETRFHYRMFLPPTIRRAARIIVPSHSVKRQLEQMFGLDGSRIKVVLPGISAAFRDRASQAEIADVCRRYQLPETFVLVPGNREPKKNLARLVDAFCAARRAGLAGELLMIGGAGWGKQPRALPEGVRRLRYVSERDAAILFQLASEIAFPALEEGFGLPVIEGLAAGTPVVASQVPSVEEVGSDLVTVVDPLSTASISRGLLDARADSQWRAAVHDRGIAASRQFTWERAAREVRSVYEKAAAP